MGFVMSRSRWHILRSEGALTLCRQTPPRFDVSARTTLPAADPLRVAHQVRQDLWRSLQDLRGFSPVVQVVTGADGIEVTAGGRLTTRAPANITDKISTVLEDPAKRHRWVQRAQVRQGQTS